MHSTSWPNVAVIGCGRWGKNLVRNFSQISVLTAVVDENADVAAITSEEYGVPARTWGEILADPAIEAVIIATPARVHARYALEALNAAKHVFVEKPLALTVKDATTVCELAQQMGRVVMVGHLLQYHPAFIRLNQLVTEGELGRLRYIYSNRLNLGRFRREEDILWSFAPHDISMILSLARQEPSEVSAVGMAVLHERIADVTTTHLVFPDGIRAHIFVSWLHPYKEQRLVVIGDKAMAVFNDGEPWERKLLLYPHRILWREAMPVPEHEDAVPVALTEAEPLRVECEHFLRCCAAGERPRTDGPESLRVLRVLAQATRSLQEARRPVPPDIDRAAEVALRRGVSVHASAFVDEGAEIGEDTRIWHFSHVMAGARIGKDCVIGQNVMVGADVVIGDRCKLQNNVSIYTGVTLEDGVFCGPSCVFTNVMNPRAEIERKSEFRPTLVRRGTTIGANATVVCGVTLGEHCFIGAGAVVTRDVPPFALVVGSPARRIGWVSHDGERLGSDLVCPRSKRRYRQADAERLEEIV